MEIKRASNGVQCSYELANDKSITIPHGGKGTLVDHSGTQRKQQNHSIESMRTQVTADAGIVSMNQTAEEESQIEMAFVHFLHKCCLT